MFGRVGTKGLVLLIHGLGGDKTTWGNFPELLRADAQIAARFDVAVYPYTTGVFGRGPGIAELARELDTWLGLSQRKRYSSIVVLAHSMGGLVAKQLVVDRLQQRREVTVRRILAFASPQLGALLPMLLAMAPVTGDQHRDLALGAREVGRLVHAHRSPPDGPGSSTSRKPRSGAPRSGRKPKRQRGRWYSRSLGDLVASG